MGVIVTSFSCRFATSFSLLLAFTLAIASLLLADKSVSSNPSSNGIAATRLVPSDGRPGDRFSVIINVDNGIILSGSREDDIAPTGWNAGSAYIFERVNGEWQQITRLTPRDGQRGDIFGDALALSGTVAVISAWKDDDLGRSSGSAYIFERIQGEWLETAKLLPQDGAAGDFFGISPAVDGETVMVGSFRADIAGQEGAGAVYVFAKHEDGWQQVEKLIASDSNTGDGLGRFIDIDGDWAVIGAVEDDEQGLDAGAAYVFRRQDEGWREVAKLTAPDGGIQDYFGRQVRIQGQTVMVGAMNHQRQGAVYFFEPDSSGQWQLTAKLMARDGERGKQFGRSITFDGDVAFVGAPLEPTRGVNAGSVYAFLRRSGRWQQVAKFQATETAAGDNFGRHVFYDGCDLVVAADKNDEPGRGPDVGSAYVYDLTVTGLQSGDHCQGEAALRPGSSAP